MSRKIKDIPISPLLENATDNNVGTKHGTNLAEVGTDCISRQAAIDCVMECYDNDELFEVYEDRLNELPPVEPKRIRGKWMHDGSKWKNRWICSNCGYKWFFDCIEGAFCPNCGADMREEKEK